MASAADLTCSICVTIFTDPVTLPCGHSFCRQCISALQDCPHGCSVSTEVKGLPTSLILKALAERAKEPEQKKREHGGERAEVAELCSEHEEKLKLFCVTDQQLACIICRDCEEHEGHKFKPVKEAAASLRTELEAFVGHASDDIHAVENLVGKQRAEILKTKEVSQQLMTQISSQFQDMHLFLRKRYNEIKNELKQKEEDSIEKMTEALKAAEAASSESRELVRKVTSDLKITDPDKFLKSWTKGSSVSAPDYLFRARACEIQVVNTSLSLGPYESHLQFFMWKEMLQVIQNKAELLTLKSNSQNVVISDDGRSLFCKPYQPPTSHLQSAPSFGRRSNYSTNYESSTGGLFGGKGFTVPSPVAVLHQVFSVEEFTSGQHYWEIEVGIRDYWELGIQNNSLKYSEGRYATCGPNIITELPFEGKPRKIGVHIDCSTGKLSFYDADDMKRIHTVTAAFVTTPVCAHINIKYKEPDHSPVMVCWY